MVVLGWWRFKREERGFFIDNLLARILFIIAMIRWTGLAPWKFEFPFPGSLVSTFLLFHLSTMFNREDSSQKLLSCSGASSSASGFAGPPSAYGLVFEVKGLRFNILGFGFRVWCLGCRVKGVG